MCVRPLIILIGKTLTVKEVVTNKQVLLGITEEITVWLKERNPENLGRLADKYALARQGVKRQTEKIRREL